MSILDTVLQRLVLAGVRDDYMELSKLMYILQQDRSTVLTGHDDGEPHWLLNGKLILHQFISLWPAIESVGCARQ